MSTSNLRVQSLRLLGGCVCLDFVNTIENRAGQTPDDRLTGYEDLIAWGAHAGVLNEAESKDLLLAAERNMDRARRIYSAAIALRESLHRLFRAIAQGEQPPPADLEQVTRAYWDAIGKGHLTMAGDVFRWEWEASKLERIFGVVTTSAVDLLTGADLRRVKVCANPKGCGWLFFDQSKNASRRWCSMEGCGHQAKMRRYLAKRRRSEG